MDETRLTDLKIDFSYTCMKCGKKAFKVTDNILNKFTPTIWIDSSIEQQGLSSVLVVEDKCHFCGSTHKFEVEI